MQRAHYQQSLVAISSRRVSLKLSQFLPEPNIVLNLPSLSPQPPDIYYKLPSYIQTLPFAARVAAAASCQRIYIKKKKSKCSMMFEASACKFKRPLKSMRKRKMKTEKIQIK
jgi:hypothetical protein